MTNKLLIQDGNEIREMTNKELAEYEQLQIELVAIENAQAKKVKAKQAVLDRLGITADEAALLLG